MLLTEGQIKAQVRTIRKVANRSAQAIALRADAPWTGPSEISIDGVLHHVAYCRSDLELREQLRTTRMRGEQLIALCPLATGELGEDVLARLAKRRIVQPHAADILASLFQATSIDSRIVGSPGLTNALVEFAPADGYTPVPGGVLDLQTSWLELLGRTVGDRTVAASVGGLLRASLDAAIRSRLGKLPTTLLREFFSWAQSNVDPAFEWMEPLVSASKSADLVAFGLLLGIIFDAGRQQDKDFAAARVRLEQWFRGRSIDAAVARNWADAAKLIVERDRDHAHSRQIVSDVLGRFDALIDEFKLAAFAQISDCSPLGFDQRTSAFAQALSDCVKSNKPSDSGTRKLISAVQPLREHLLGQVNARRIETCEMAARLTRWSHGYANAFSEGSLEGLVQSCMRDGGFVEWGRAVVQEGDIDPGLNNALNLLLARVDEFCRAFEANFARRVAAWSMEGNPPSAAFTPIENALENLVGPLAGQHPILLLVMDGLSVAVFRELLTDIIGRGHWVEYSARNPVLTPSLLATVPSVTQISRRALFRGKLHPESSPTEQSAFHGNEKLHSQCGGATKPALFLKGDLQTSGAATARTGSPSQKD